jgi:hypothetical protein
MSASLFATGRDGSGAGFVDAVALMYPAAFLSASSFDLSGEDCWVLYPRCARLCSAHLYLSATLKISRGLNKLHAGATASSANPTFSRPPMFVHRMAKGL